jgi:hypothetical protein
VDTDFAVKEKVGAEYLGRGVNVENITVVTGVLAGVPYLSKAVLRSFCSGNSALAMLVERLSVLLQPPQRSNVRPHSASVLLTRAAA